MAITRAQQARQMLKKAGFVVQDGFKNYIKNSESVTVPKEFKSRENATPTKLAYITKDEAKMLKKMKKGTPHKGPKGIPSYDDFDAATGGFRSGAAMSAAETGGKTERDRADMRAAGIGPKEARDLRSAAIAAGAGQRVNPGFFDSRNLVSPTDLAAARAIAPKAFARSRGSGLGAFISGGGILGNLIRGLGQRLGFGRRFNEPSFDMSRFRNLPLGGSAAFQNLDIRDKFDRTADDDTTNIDEFGYSPNFLSGLVDEVALTGTPEQKELIKEKIEDTQDQADDSFLQGAMAKLNALETREYNNLLTGKELNMNTPEQNKRLEELEKKKKEEASLINRAIVADGGMIGGGIMDAAGRQQYFLGKLVKKAKRAVKKIVKSPIGKIGLGALALKLGGGFAADGFLRSKALPFLLDNKALALGAGLAAAPLLFQQEEEQGEGLSSTGVGPNIDLQGIRRDPFAFQAPSIAGSRFAFAEGSKEPVAKKTMPLLDMGGQEMDLRAEGGFVPIGRMEKADDVPARLSKNEFVFTADAVRNAGDGNVDKGAEVMYNMMKNLEAGGNVSEESQGKQGARRMFQTSQRLEEVL